MSSDLSVITAIYDAMRKAGIVRTKANSPTDGYYEIRRTSPACRQEIGVQLVTSPIG